MSMSLYVNVSICLCVDLSMCLCVNMSMCRFVNVSMCQYVCVDLSMCLYMYVNVSIIQVNEQVLYINRYCRMLKYWFKILKTENCILKNCYEDML